MLNYIKDCLTTKYADFNGRARRSEFWYFSLFITLVSWLLRYIVTYDEFNSNQVLIVYINLFFVLAVIIPRIAVGIRRMHDVGKSGWYILVPFYNLYLACADSQVGENEYGPNPKGIGNSSNADDLINSIGSQQ